MPIYEYACAQCDKNHEITRGFNDQEIIPQCPLCGYKMARVYNTPGVQFKGPGFYSTGG